MSPKDFVDKWQAVTTSERASAQSHFNDLCDLLGEPKPHDDDPTGERYAFEKGAEKTSGGDGWADVWKRGAFAWEYKGKHKDLDQALDQVKQYALALENPPLLVVCDIERIVVVTNWTNRVSVRTEIKLAELINPKKLDFLKRVFHGDESLRTGELRADLTKKVAQGFAVLAQELEQAGYAPLVAAHFVIRLVFCLFAQDSRLLPDRLVTRMLQVARPDPSKFVALAEVLFKAMSIGDLVGFDTVDWFNGGLFDSNAALPLTRAQIDRIRTAALLDWSAIDPSILGTLFERGLDPAKRSQLGAHYTDPVNIMRIVDPVVLCPLREEWAIAQKEINALSNVAKQREVFNRYLLRLRAVTVLDPACGSGNFLYMALRGLKDLEHEVLLAGEILGLGRSFSEIGPEVLRGIELSPYAAELARVSIWIGDIQWQIEHGQNVKRDPILRDLNTIENRDALLTAEGDEAEWPAAEFIVGNPPFLGGSLLRRELGSDGAERLFRVYGDRIPNFSDLCAYWFEKARAQIEAQKSKSTGLIATQGIRGKANRTVLERIKNSGDIFFAWSDLDWVLEGAAVHVSIVGFDSGLPIQRFLNGIAVHEIHANLTAFETDIGRARALPENAGQSFMGPSAKAPFDIPESIALEMLVSPNPKGFPNSDVLRPVASASDLTGINRALWTIDFGELSASVSCHYEFPYQHVDKEVKPIREQNRRIAYAEKWWQYAEARPGLRQATNNLRRVLVTPGVSKYRLFRWYPTPYLCNQGTLVFAFEDDYSFGILQSRFHEVWALAQGTQLREKESGFRYTPTTCFETFPFPQPTQDQRDAISEAARELNELRESWLNPPEWTVEEPLIFPATVGGPWNQWIPNADQLAKGRVAPAHYIRRVPHPAMKKTMSARTLTKLYNSPPAWLQNAHRALNTAVAAAYAVSPDIAEAELLSHLLSLNLELAKV